MSQCMTKPAEWLVRPARTQISLGISLRCPSGPWLLFEPTAKTLISLDRCLGWSKSLLGTKVILLVLSCCSSNSSPWDNNAWVKSIKGISFLFMSGPKHTTPLATCVVIITGMSGWTLVGQVSPQNRLFFWWVCFVVWLQYTDKKQSGWHSKYQIVWLNKWLKTNDLINFW